MDGFGLLRALKANPMTAGIPVIMLTSKATSEDEQKALEQGFIDFIPKPVQPVRIISRVKRALELTRKYKR
jgi:CheY-like chemotaxis protein